MPLILRGRRAATRFGRGDLAAFARTNEIAVIKPKRRCMLKYQADLNTRSEGHKYGRDATDFQPLQFRESVR